MATELQEVYIDFLAKENKDYTYKQDLVFSFLKTAIGYSYKTTPQDLTYVLDVDNVVFIIYNIATSNGNITVNINDDSYIIPILTTDTILGIANKINSAINNDYTVVVSSKGTYPILTITKSSVTEINSTIVDTDNTEVEIDVGRTYDGNFPSTLTCDTIQLLTLFMKKESLRKQKAELENMKTYIGTKDFNKLPDKKSELKVLIDDAKYLDDEIQAFRQEFYTYST